jgi:glycosyltransferase involved in cell wall biosynthesis
MPKVVWYFRKKRDLGNFSIENSFRELLPHFEGSEWEIEWREASWFSEGIWNRLRIAMEARGLQSDVIHITGDIHFAAMFLQKRRVVLTIHDNGHIEQCIGLKQWLMKKLWLDWPLKQCEKVVAVSEATKRSILDLTSANRNQVEVIPTVVSSHFKPRKGAPNNPKPVLLHIGLAPNKNLSGHAAAIEGMDVLLRIIGEPSAADRAMLESKGIDYEWKSRLSDSEMQEAYASSNVLLFCSTLEGFGMPILEAKAVGVPVVTSAIAPMNKVGKGYAFLADPNEPGSIKKSLMEALESKTNAQCDVSLLANSKAAALHYISLYSKIHSEK